MIAGKPNICYDDSGKSLSRASNTCAYTKDEMDGFFLLYKAKIAPQSAPKENRKVPCEIEKNREEIMARVIGIGHQDFGQRLF